MQSQKRGKSGQLVDPRPQTIDGEAKIVITPQLVHDIFDEYPIVQTAYAENVPDKVRVSCSSLYIALTSIPCLLFHRHQLSEAQFWKRYFSSKLFHAHQASIRSSATQFVAKEDPIFDKYLEKDDDGGYPCHLTCYTACADSSHNLVLTVLKASNPEDHGQKPLACLLISQQRLRITVKYAY